MSEHDYDLLVVGSGPGGQAAAIAAAQLGKRVAIVERKPYVGGVSLQTGTIPSKALREAAYLRSRDAGLGMRNRCQEPATLDPGFLRCALRQKDHIIDHKEAQLLSKLMDAGITLIPGEARFLDPHRLAISHASGKQTEITGTFIILATGSRPRRPTDIPFDKARILDSSSVLKMKHLPQSMVIVGGGVIACEFATIFAPLGVRITLVDSHPQLLAYLDDDLVEQLAANFRDMGIQLHMNSRLRSISLNDQQGVQLETEQGDTLQAECLLYALGREPNYSGLMLENAGLHADDHGWVRINDDHQTTQAHIYIVGDLAGRPSLASTAMEQGRIAAYHAFDRAHAGSRGPLPMAIYTIPEVSYIGETERQLQARAAQYVVGKADYRDVARGQIIGNETGLLKLLVDRHSRELLGVHILGESASELIHVGQMAMTCGASIDTLATTVFNYPTLAQCYKDAALACLQQLE